MWSVLTIFNQRSKKEEFRLKMESSELAELHPCQRKFIFRPTIDRYLALMLMKLFSFKAATGNLGYLVIGRMSPGTRRLVAQEAITPASYLLCVLLSPLLV